MAESIYIWYVASPSRPLSSIFSNYGLGPNRFHPWGRLVHIGLYSENYKKNTRHRALIFGMWHHQVDLGLYIGKT